MEITQFFASFYGFHLIIMALLMIGRKDFLYQIIEVVENKKTSILLGFIALFLGLATVILHNEWVAEQKVIITIIGWAALVKGILLIGWPGMFSEFTKKITGKFYWPWSIIALALGIYLVYVAGYSIF